MKSNFHGYSWLHQTLNKGPAGHYKTYSFPVPLSMSSPSQRKPQACNLQAPSHWLLCRINVGREQRRELQHACPSCSAGPQDATHQKTAGVWESKFKSTHFEPHLQKMKHSLMAKNEDFSTSKDSTFFRTLPTEHVGGQHKYNFKKIFRYLYSQILCKWQNERVQISTIPFSSLFCP